MSSKPKSTMGDHVHVEKKNPRVSINIPKETAAPLLTHLIQSNLIYLTAIFSDRHPPDLFLTKETSLSKQHIQSFNRLLCSRNVPRSPVPNRMYHASDPCQSSQSPIITQNFS